MSDAPPRFFSVENLPRIAAAVFSGAILRLVSPPVGLDWIHWFTFVPLLVVVADPTGGPVPRGPGPVAWVGALLRSRNFRLGYLTGLSGVFLLFFWLADTIVTFSNIPLPVAAFIILLFAGIFGLPYGFLAAAVAPLRARFGGWWALVFPAVWVAAEFAQPALFPYYQGVGQYRNPYTWQLASVFGAYGLSWLLLLTNSTLAEAWLSRRAGSRLPWAQLAVAAVLFVANLGFGVWRFDRVEATLAAAPTARVTILQQGITMLERIQDRGSKVLRSWVELTAKAAESDPDLVIWPEGAIWDNPTDKRPKEFFAKLTTEGGFSLLVGGGTHVADPDDPTQRAHWNSAYFFGEDGEVKGRYDKMVPMPFGEYLPWPVSYLKAYIRGVGSFRPGTEPTVFHANTFSFSVPICYEAILDRQMRTLSEADVFVNITNDGWFGDTAAPHQHAMLSAAHAVELGRPMVRVAYTGISMVIEPHGVIKYETAPYTEVAEVVPLRLATFATPYRTWGRYFPHVCALVAVAWLGLEAIGVVTRRPPPA